MIPLSDREVSPRFVLAALCVCGLAIRLAAIPFVPVLDDGVLFVYDAWQLLQGQTPMVDYPTRSPVFLAIIAGFFSIGGASVVTARIGLAVVATIVGVVLYLVTRELHSEEAGVAAAFVFFLTPYSITWGLTVKTELTAQLFVLVGLLALVRELDGDTIRRRTLGFTGVLFGLGFLTRKVVVVQAVAVGLFLVYDGWRQGHPVATALGRSLPLAVGMAGTLCVGYAILAWPSATFFVDIVRQHFAGLVVGNGLAVTWVDPSLSGLGPLSGHGPAHAVTSLYLLIPFGIVSLPAVLPLIAVPAVLLGEVADAAARAYLLAVGLCAVGGGVVFGVLVDVSPLYLLAVPMVFAGIGYLRVFETPPLASLRPHALVLPVLLVGLVLVGYLYRGGLEILYLFDVFPYVAVLSGVTIAGFVSRPTVESTVSPTSVGIVLLVVAAVVSLVTTQMFLPAATLTNPGSEKTTVTDLEAAGDDLADRTAPTDRVFTTDPVLGLKADRQVTAGLSRKLWVLIYFPDSDAGEHVRQEIRRDLDSGTASHVILDDRMERLLDRNPGLNESVRSHYCPVDGTGTSYWQPELFGTLYEHQSTRACSI